MQEPRSRFDTSEAPDGARVSFAPPSAPPPGPRPRSRARGGGARLTWLLALVAVSIPVAAAVYFAREADANRRAAVRWQAQASSLNEVLRERTAVLNTRTRALNQTSARLTASEADVKTLERRQRRLADEKAQVEDQKGFIATVARDQRACSDGLLDLLVAFAEYDYSWIDATIDGVSDACLAAADGFESIRAIESLDEGEP
jgi:hypothetical protein